MPEQLQVPAWLGIPKNSSEYITLIAHYYRAEMARMSGWRDRIDRTTNWAITVATVSTSAMLLRTLLEATRPSAIAAVFDAGLHEVMLLLGSPPSFIGCARRECVSEQCARWN